MTPEPQDPPLRCLFSRCKSCGQLMWIGWLEVVYCGCPDFLPPPRAK